MEICSKNLTKSSFSVSNVCQNGLSAGGAVNSANLPAVPLPESVARSLHSATAGAPYHASAHQQQGHLAVATSSAGAAAAAPPPKPLYRPFALSPPPSTPKVSTATPHTPATPFYPPYSNPFFPNSYNPFYPTSSTSFNNGLFPPPQTTTPTSTLATHTVASSHHDLTCKSHLPKLAHALTNSAPRATPTATPIKSSYPSLPLNDPANLRRELDNRYLHDRSLIRPPTYMGSADVSNPLTARLAPPFQRPPNNQSPGFLSASLVSFKDDFVKRFKSLLILFFYRAKIQKWAGPTHYLRAWARPRASQAFRLSTL